MAAVVHDGLFLEFSLRLRRFHFWLLNTFLLSRAIVLMDKLEENWNVLSTIRHSRPSQITISCMHTINYLPFFAVVSIEFRVLQLLDQLGIFVLVKRLAGLYVEALVGSQHFFHTREDIEELG